MSFVRFGPDPRSVPPNRLSLRGVTGAASELVVCAELMRLGYHVFRCESPTAPFDLVAYRDGQCLRVEVKSLSFQQNSAPVVSVPTNDEWDLVAYVGRDADVFVFQPQPSADALRRLVHDRVRAHYGFAPRNYELQPCGTPAAYLRHRKAEEQPCDPCRQAYRLSERQRKERT